MSTQLERHVRYLLVLPLLLLTLAIVAFPTVYAYSVSLHDSTLGQSGGAPFVGVANYAAVVRDTEYWRSIGYSLRYSVIVTLAELLLGLAIAILFNRTFRGKGALISLFLLPMMVAPALLAIMFRLMLNEFVGVIPQYLSRIGFNADLLGPRWVNVTLTIIDVLQWTPFTFLILYAGLQSQPHELYEAAQVDGASGWQIFRNITLPLLLPFVGVTALLRCIDAFKIFDLIYVLTNGGPGNLTTSVSIYIYKLGFVTGHIGKATAASIVLLILLSLPLGAVLRKVLRWEGPQ